VFENRLLRIFGSKREDVAGGCRRTYNEEFHNLYTLPNVVRVMKSREMRCVGLVACIREMRNAYKILVRKPEGKRPCGRIKCRWEGNIRMDVREIG
jgi:hypothetical protein